MAKSQAEQFTKMQTLPHPIVVAASSLFAAFTLAPVFIIFRYIEYSPKRLVFIIVLSVVALSCVYWAISRIMRARDRIYLGGDHMFTATSKRDSGTRPSSDKILAQVRESLSHKRGLIEKYLTRIPVADWEQTVYLEFLTKPGSPLFALAGNYVALVVLPQGRVEFEVGRGESEAYYALKDLLAPEFGPDWTPDAVFIGLLEDHSLEQLLPPKR